MHTQNQNNGNGTVVQQVEAIVAAFSKAADKQVKLSPALSRKVRLVAAIMGQKAEEVAEEELGGILSQFLGNSGYAEDCLEERGTPDAALRARHYDAILRGLAAALPGVL